MQSQSPPSRPQRAKQHSPGHPPWTPIHPLGFQFRFERHGGVVSRADSSVGDRDAATYNMRGFPRFDHFVGQKTWEFFSRRNGCNGQLDRNSRFVRPAAKNGASSSHLLVQPLMQSSVQRGSPPPPRLSLLRYLGLASVQTHFFVASLGPTAHAVFSSARISAPAALVPTSLPWSCFCSNSLLRRISWSNRSCSLQFSADLRPRRLFDRRSPPLQKVRLCLALPA